MHNGCHSTRSLRIHGLAHSASRIRTGYVNKPDAASSQCVVPDGYRSGSEQQERRRAVVGGHEQDRGAVAVAAMIYLAIM